MKLRKVVFFAPQKYFKVEVKVAVVKLSQDRSFFFKVLLKCMKNRCAQEILLSPWGDKEVTHSSPPSQ